MTIAAMKIIEAEKIAAQIRKGGAGNPELLTRLCNLAGLKEAGQTTDQTKLKSAAQTAAKKLGVEI